MPSESAILFHLGRGDVTPADVIALADGRYRAMLDPSEEYASRIDRGAELVQRRVAAEGRLRGVTTRMRAVDEPGSDRAQQQMRQSFTRYHGVGVGDTLPDRLAASVVAVRLASLSRGFSGVRRELLTLLCAMLNLRVLPRIPTLGSAGWNADSVPLSYLAAAVVGDGDVSYLGRVVPATEALRAARLQPIALRPKEALALMSGTGLMTALGCVAWDRSRRFVRFASALSAMALDVTGCGVSHLDPRIDGLKPHPGARTVSEWLREDVEYAAREKAAGEAAPELLRAAAHILGTQLDATTFAGKVLEIELNSVCDDPIVHPAAGEFLLGGNFYGGAVALALDGIKSTVFTTASMLERILTLVCDPALNGGLPLDLAHPEQAVAHGFRGMRASAAGLLGDLAALASPAALRAHVAARDPTELSSMGTHAARDCQEALSLAETIASMTALALCQAVDLREGSGCHRRAKTVYGATRQLVPRLEADRAQDRDITSVLELFRAGLLPVGLDA